MEIIININTKSAFWKVSDMTFGSNHFEFTYKAEDGTLYLDFALDYVTDCQYTYTVDGNKLTLIGGKGTAEVGKVYELTLVKE